MSVNFESDDRLGSLVAMLLRDRDTQCPCCGYSLKGIEGSICPECACELDFQIVDRKKPESEQKAVRLGILFLALYSAIYVIVNTASLVSNLVYGTIPTTLVSGAVFFGGQIFWMFMLLWTVGLWSRGKNRIRLRTKHFLKPAVAILVMHFFGLSFHIYAAVQSLISVL